MRVPMPVVFAVVCGVACQDTVSPVPALSPSAQVAVSGDSIRLTYICGNTFRLRNANDDYVEVKWDIFNTPDSGRLVLPKRPAGQAFSQVFVTANRRGTMRVFFNGRLEETKANGNRPACSTEGQETPWPTVPGFSAIDASKLIRYDNALRARADWFVVFAEGATDAQRVAAIRSVRGTVTSYFGPRRVVIRVPDPGPDSMLVESALQALRGMAGVERAYAQLAGAVTRGLNARYPRDSASRDVSTAWTLEDADGWYRAATRIPAAWGCLPDSPVVAPLAVWEWRAPGRSTELIVNAVTPTSSDYPDSLLKPVAGDISRAHGYAVVGLAVASADNHVGTAGTLFKAEARVVQLETPDGKVADVASTAQFALKSLREGPEIVSVSIDIIATEGSAESKLDQAEALAFALKDALARSPDKQIVLAAGNDGFTGSLDAFSATVGASSILTRAILQVRADSALADRVLVVTGTRRNGGLASPFGPGKLGGATVVTGLTDIAAPALDIAVLDTASTGESQNAPVGRLRRDVFGTSLAAPQVAGVLAAMRLFDPAMTPAGRKAILLSAARGPRLTTNGVVQTPTPVVPASQGQNAVHPLDAYGALTITAARSRNAPLCGQRIATDSAGTTPRILRDSLPAEDIALPAGYSLRAPGNSIGPVETEWASVAQGGRLISINAQNAAGEPYLLTYALGPNGWVPSAPIRSDYTRTFLERDTAYVRWIPDLQLSGRFLPAGEIRRQRGGTLSIAGDRVRAALANRDQQFRPSTPTSIRVSPDGSAFAVTYTFGFADFCFDGQPIGAGLATFALGDSAAATFKLPEEPTDCSTRFVVGKDMAWHPSSQLAVVLTQDASFAGKSPAGFRLQAYRRGSGVSLSRTGPRVAQTDSIALLSGIRGDGGLAQVELLPLTTLQRVCQTRPVTRLDVVATTVNECNSTERTPLLRAQPISVALDGTAIRQLQRTRWRATLPSP